MSMLQINDTRYAGVVKAETTYQDQSQAWLRVFEKNVESALSAMGDAIVYRARMTAPYKDGALAESGRKDVNELSVEVAFGGESVGVPYGAYQERGRRLDGSHVVRNYTTPGTGKNFLKNASESVLKEGIGKYIK